VRRVLQLALGVMAAAGGFIDIGDLVFATQAGAHFRYSLLWALAVGTVGIILYSEMCGRVAAVARKPVFEMVRERYGFGLGLVTLTASELLNVLTCAAEIGGVALVLRLLTGLPYGPLIVAGAVGIGLIALVLPFEGIENLFGWLGLMLLVFLATALAIGFDWRAAALGLVPGTGVQGQPLLYAYFAVGILASTLMPYEVYFYSSGGIEQGWGPEDLALNRLTAGLGYSLGALLVVGLVAMSAEVFAPANIAPQTIGALTLPPLAVFGRAGVLLALGGMLFTVGGAVIETAFSGAYNLAQYLGWIWGKSRRAGKAPRFTAAWLFMLAAGVLIVATGVDPVRLTEYAVIFSVVVMPLTYLPILLVVGDRKVMGEHVNNPVMTVLGWTYLAVITVVAVAAVPLMVLTNGGQG
jgi:manganese transport protein